MSSEKILELSANKQYSIIKFKLYKDYGYITTDDKKEYWINKQCYKILDNYFKMKNGKITCTYNSKLVYPKLTLITEDKVKFSGPDYNGEKLIQKLKLEIEESKQVKHFTFYINHSEDIDLSKEGFYKFSTILILYNRLIFGYECDEDKYYNLSQFRDYIIKNIDDNTSSLMNKTSKTSQRQASPSEKSKIDYNASDIYTYLYKESNSKTSSSSVKPLGMGIKINEDNNYEVVNGNLNKTFEKLLDITKLVKNNKIIVKDDVEIDF